MIRSQPHRPNIIKLSICYFFQPLGEKVGATDAGDLRWGGCRGGGWRRRRHHGWDRMETKGTRRGMTDDTERERGRER